MSSRRRPTSSSQDSGSRRSLTDYLAGLGTDAKSRLLCELDTHFGLYLHGRQIYNFDEAQPGNVRLMATSIQPSLTNR